MLAIRAAAVSSRPAFNVLASFHKNTGHTDDTFPTTKEAVIIPPRFG